MSAKTLLPNQCIPLHIIYGHDDCCLCKANGQIEELKSEIVKLKEKIKELEDKSY